MTRPKFKIFCPERSGPGASAATIPVLCARARETRGTVHGPGSLRAPGDMNTASTPYDARWPAAMRRITGHGNSRKRSSTRAAAGLGADGEGVLAADAVAE